MSTASSTPSTIPAKRHGLTPVERQKAQLDRLSKDPAKPAYIPATPQEKMVRAPREMMKNVQGSSAGAGSGEFHVYKAGRRREYERLKIFQEQSEKEKRDAEFEQKRKEAEAQADAKTAKNRAKRQKKKEQRGKVKTGAEGEKKEDLGNSDMPFKKRRLVDGGKELVFKKPGEGDGDSEASESGETGGPSAAALDERLSSKDVDNGSQPVPVETPRVLIHEED